MIPSSNLSSVEINLIAKFPQSDTYKHFYIPNLSEICFKLAIF